MPELLFKVAQAKIMRFTSPLAETCIVLHNKKCKCKNAYHVLDSKKRSSIYLCNCMHADQIVFSQKKYSWLNVNYSSIFDLTNFLRCSKLRRFFRFNYYSVVSMSLYHKVFVNLFKSDYNDINVFLCHSLIDCNVFLYHPLISYFIFRLWYKCFNFPQW